MRHRPIAHHSLTDTRASRTARRSGTTTAAQLRREQARHLAWFNI